MGVIKKIECPIHIKYASSEETLYIPSDDEQSVIEEEEVDTRAYARVHNRPRLLRHNVPTVGPSSSNLRSNSGKKKSRRYQNVNQLITLAEEDEIQEVTIDDFVGSTKTPFSILLEDENSLEKWDEFVCSSEEKQQQVINEGKEKKCNLSKQSDSPEINATLRRLLRRKSFPTGILQYLEEELVSFFSAMPTKTYISRELSSFERLLLHSLSEYHRLISVSFDSDPEQIRLVRVRNPRKEFPSPPLLLVQYLETVHRAN
ncbi:UNVERIFIED_CONTAM: hypothetical protein PYX00_005479 [Menopon gallinae]|uniref:R3H domain-containing protein n=1 Tax=Menopon gallinae TaxID=328185 RepID=A0AAW2HSC8_9NEOP